LLAVWRLGPTGGLSGAWVLPLDELTRDSTRVDNVMGTLAGRCLVGWDKEAPLAVLRKVDHLLPARTVSRLSASTLAIPDLLDEVREFRHRYAVAVQNHQATTKSKLAPLPWAAELVDPAGDSAHVLAPRLPAAASPVAADALAVVGALQAAIELWRDTEQTRYRRTYLRSFGRVQPLLPRWLEQLRAAAS
jgi:hypothetical protein